MENKKVFVIVCLITLGLSISAQWYKVEGKGRFAKRAIYNAGVKAAQKFIAKKVGSSAYNRFSYEIKKYLNKEITNYYNLKNDVEIIKKHGYRLHSIVVRIRFEEERLLADLGQKYPGLKKKTKPKKVKGVSAFITTKGKGLSRKLAINDAWKNAMFKHLKKKLEKDVYLIYNNKIKSFIKSGWFNYAHGDYTDPLVVKRFFRRSITIKVRLAHKELLKAIKEDVSDIAKYKKTTVYITQIKSLKGITKAEKKIVIKQFHKALPSRFVIFKKKKDKNIFFRKRLTGAGIVKKNSKAYARLKKTIVKVSLSYSLKVKTKEKTKGTISFHPTIVVKAHYNPKAKSLFSLVYNSGKGIAKKVKITKAAKNTPKELKKARDKAIANLAKFVAARVNSKLKNI